MEEQLAIIRLRGTTGIRSDVEDTLRLLNLKQINHCTVVRATPSVIGMLRKAKDYITWGTVDSQTFKMLVEKRGKLAAADSKHFSFNSRNYRLVFRLSPAKGGLGRRGIKASFSSGGALGDRGEKINDLIKKML